MSVRFSSEKIEKGILALLLKSPVHVRALSLKPNLFAFSKHQQLFSLIRKFVQAYKAAPTKETLINFANTQIKDEADLEIIPEAIELLDTLPDINVEEANYYFKRGTNYLIGRNIYDLHTYAAEKMQEHEVDFLSLKKDMMEQLVKMGEDDESIRRGYIYENIKDRFYKYESAEKGELGEIIPFGIRELDEEIKGMKKSFVTLAYSKTGGGKSRLAINLAYNAAVAGYNVMYVSLEMDFDILANCFDSRIAAIDSKKIIFGDLQRSDKIKFAKALKQQAKEKLNIWISDIPQAASMAKLLEEIEIYKTVNGTAPDFIVVDYANLMEPTVRYSNTSTKYDNLLKEMKQTARYYGCSLFTMLQESRDATLASIDSKNKKKDEIEGVHNIGQSNYAAIHCETVFHLKQSDVDKLRNRVWIVVNKNRYGASGKKIPLFAAWDITFVGNKQSETSVKMEKK